MLDQHSVIPELGHTWQQCLQDLDANLDVRARSAILNSVPLEVKGQRLRIGVHGSFSRDFLNRKACLEAVRSIVHRRTQRSFEVEFVSIEGLPPAAPAPDATATDDVVAEGRPGLGPRRAHRFAKALTVERHLHAPSAAAPAARRFGQFRHIAYRCARNMFTVPAARPGFASQIGYRLRQTR